CSSRMRCTSTDPTMPRHPMSPSCIYLDSSVMPGFLVAVAFSAAQACSPAALADIKEASARVQAFDLAGAVDHLRQQWARGCEDTQIAGLYLAGLFAAMEAYKQGGSAESLVPVRD